MPRDTVLTSARSKSSDATKEAGSSVGRVFDVLDLFSLERPMLRVEDVSALLGYTRSTSYRYVKALAAAGFVSPIGGGYYALGGRAIELDRLVQLTDPLLHAGQSVMPALVEQVPEAAFLLCSLYGDKVLCIHHEGPPALEYRGRKVSISRPRGMPFSLFSGAASLAILAHLPPYRIKSLYLHHQQAIHDSAFAHDWQSFRSRLAEVRELGHAWSTGTFNQYLAGIAVPVLASDGIEVMGSLTQVQARDRYDEAGRRAVAEHLREATQRIAAAVAKTRGSR